MFDLSWRQVGRAGRSGSPTYLISSRLMNSSNGSSVGRSDLSNKLSVDELIEALNLFVLAFQLTLSLLRD